MKAITALAFIPLGAIGKQIVVYKNFEELQFLSYAIN